MPQAVFVQEGDYVDYRPAVAIPAGEVVVQGDLVGVAVRPIEANQLGSLLIEGVFDFAKAAGTALTVGTVVYWDDVANVVTTVASTTTQTNKQIGKVVSAAAASDTTVRVKLKP